jgi:hypothetical protein
MKSKLKRETDVWVRVMDRAGRAPEGARFMYVRDRGAENFGVFCHLLEQQAGWVIRAAQLKRRVRDVANRECVDIAVGTTRRPRGARRGSPDPAGLPDRQVSCVHRRPRFQRCSYLLSGPFHK